MDETPDEPAEEREPRLDAILRDRQLRDPQLVGAAYCVGPTVLRVEGDDSVGLLLDDLADLEEAGRRASRADRRSLSLAYAARRRLLVRAARAFRPGRGHGDDGEPRDDEDFDEFVASVSNVVYNVEQDLAYAIDCLAA